MRRLCRRTRRIASSLAVSRSSRCRIGELLPADGTARRGNQNLRRLESAATLAPDRAACGGGRAGGPASETGRGHRRQVGLRKQRPRRRSGRRADGRTLDEAQLARRRVPSRGGGPAAEDRPRIRDLGVSPGILPPGRWNAITDVEGVRVGHKTLVEGESIRTGVTAILPAGDNLFQQKFPAAVYVGNGFGKAAGFLQVAELGNLETPIVLTNTLAVGTAVDAVVQWTLGAARKSGDPLRQRRRGGDERRLGPERHSRDARLHRRRPRRDRGGARRRRRGRQRRRGNRDRRARLEGRHRDLVAQAAGVALGLHRRRARADELRRRAHDRRRARRGGARTICVPGGPGEGTQGGRRLLHDRPRDRRAAFLAQSRAARANARCSGSRARARSWETARATS